MYVRGSITSLFFQFTTSQGGRLSPANAAFRSFVFQFTTSQGGRPAAFAVSPPSPCTFNSRPHKEVDTFLICSFLSFYIFQFTTSQGGRRLSAVKPIADELFQFTTSQGGRLFLLSGVPLPPCPFNSRPHKEVDRKYLQ